MVTLPFWVLIALVQGLVLLAGATGFLAWRLRVASRAREAARSDAESEGPAPGDSLREHLDQELERTRLEQHSGDRNLPAHVLEARLHYLQSERDALDYANQADRLWTHLCDRIENGPGAPTVVTDEDDSGLEATHQRLRRLLGQLEDGCGESAVTVRQLAVIERRLAALQRQEDATDQEEPEAPAGDPTDPDEALTNADTETDASVAESASEATDDATGGAGGPDTDADDTRT